jgi:Rv0078B-related antitoxin
MTPEQKLMLAANLHQKARALKAAGLREQHPDWSEKEIQKKVREIFLYATT